MAGIGHGPATASARGIGPSLSPAPSAAVALVGSVSRDRRAAVGHGSAMVEDAAARDAGLAVRDPRGGEGHGPETVVDAATGGRGDVVLHGGRLERDGRA